VLAASAQDRLGGVATMGELLDLVSRREVVRSVSAREIIRAGRGRFATAEADRAPGGCEDWT
jgi:hypothetical protein